MNQDKIIKLKDLVIQIFDLFIESPKKKTWKSMEDYWKSKEWKSLRNRVKKRSGNICEYCKTYSMYAVHHKTYERLYNEELSDLVGLCRDCHEKMHEVEDG